MIVLGTVLASPAAFAGENAANSPAAGRLRIGTYDTRVVALAYLRSDEFKNGELPRLQAELNKAKDAGDQKKIDELRPKTHRLQRLAHAQVFSNAPIDNILPKLKEQMPAVAKKANVCAIVPSANWNDPSVELVDVTDMLAEHFKPDDETRKLMGELRKHKPMDLVEAVMMED
jgi:hypothetical protein